MKSNKKTRFLKNFRERFLLRFHMVAILSATACSGFMASKLLLTVGLKSTLVRYPLSVLIAYLFFFLCIKLWLLYVMPDKKPGRSRSGDWFDIPDLSGTGGSGITDFHSGGGQFGGAGASSAFEVNAAEAAISPGEAVGETASGATEGIGSAVGEAAGALGDEGGLAAVVVGVVLLALIATILGSAGYLLYEAPVILSETAFEGLLAASLIRGTRNISSGDWVGSIFRSTWKPLIFTLIMAMIAGGVLHHYFPEAKRLSDVFRMI